METHPSIDKATAYFDVQLGQIPGERRIATAPFITISRESGTGGSALAEEIARRLNRLQEVEAPAWTVFDRDLVARMLEDQHLSSSLARYLPENRVSEIDASVGEIVGLHPSIWTMVHATNNLMRRLAALGHAIIVGRGANYATAGSPHGLHVRLVASTARRAVHTAEQRGLTNEQAAAVNRKTDHARRDFVRSFFDADIDDPGAYHVVVNMDHFTTGTAADLVVSILRSREKAEEPRARAV